MSEEDEEDRTPLYQCEECEGGLLECQMCFIHRHQCLPFYRVEVCCSPSLCVTLSDGTSSRTACFSLELTSSCWGYVCSWVIPVCPASIPCLEWRTL